MKRVLVVEDEALMRAELCRLLEREGYQAIPAGDVDTAKRIGLDTVDLVLTDLHLPGQNGDKLIELVDNVPVVLLTGQGSIRSAVDAIKRGAADYLTKPFDPDELKVVVARLLAQRRAVRRQRALARDVAAQWDPERMVGNCPGMRAVKDLIGKVAPLDSTALVLGESGTGKELVARALHERSTRADGPFVAVNCAAIPETLFESELFGHEAGAFTGATSTKEGLFRAAQGGVLFLDEIGEISMLTQARLLRAVQNHEVRPVGSSRVIPVDVRIVCATNRDLHQEVEEGRFRRDLLYRISVVEIRLPPLRERGDDRLLLAQTLLDVIGKRLGRPDPSRFSAAAVEAIYGYHWPGNVRELENAIERALILAEDEEVDDFMLGLPDAWSSTPAPDTSLAEYFRRFVLEHQDQLTETELARQLGISRKTLYQRRRRFGLPRPSK